jgi:uncharacterized protein (DUF983 family)
MPGESGLGRAGHALARGARLRCPRCGRAPIFRGWFTMRPECLACGLRFERAQGYFVGAIYINYALTATIAIVGYLLLWRYADVSLAVQFAVWIPFVVLFPLWFFRYSRSFWLALEYFFNPEH